MSIRYALRSLRGHWQAGLILWLALLAVATTAAALPAYATAVAGDVLARQLAAAPTAARNLLIGGEGLDNALYAGVRQTLGPLLSRRVETRDLEIEGLPVLYTPDGEWPFDEYLALHLYSFDDLARDVTLLDGRLPAPDAGGVIEAAVGPAVLDGPNFSTAAGGQITLANLNLGDELRAPDGSRFRIVGVVEPKEPANDVWWGTLVPFRFSRQARNGTNLPETVVVSLIIPPEEMVGRFPDHAHQWRLLTDPTAVTAGNAAAVSAAVRDVETGLASNFLQVDTGLGELLDTFAADLAQGRVILFLWAATALPAVLAAVALVAAAAAGQRREPFVTLRRRGADTGRIVIAELPVVLLAAAAAAVVAPGLAFVLLRLWRGDASTAVPAESWLWAVAGASIGALIAVAALIVVARGAGAWARPDALPPGHPLWQRYYLDILLLVAGGLLYRQSLAASGAADLLLLLGPMLLPAGAALLATRLAPWLLRGMAALAGGRGLLWACGTARAGRAPADSGRLTLVAALTVATVVAAALMAQSLVARQAQLARYLTGADVRVTVPLDTETEVYATFAALDGVVAVTPTYRNERARWAADLNRRATLLAVDPVGFSAVGRFPPDTSSLAMVDILPALTTPTGTALPAVFSRDAYPQDKGVGDIVTYTIGSEQIDFEVRGLIDSFPSLDGPFVLTNLALLEERLDFARLGEAWTGQREVWLAAEPGQAEAVAAAITGDDGPPGSAVADSAAARRATLSGDMTGQQATAALRLIPWVVGALGATAVGMTAAAAARRRGYEFGVLGALGVSPGQRLRLAWLEGAVALGIGLVAGTIIGIGTAQLMLPILSRMLAAAVGNDAIHRLVLDWPVLLGLPALLAVAFGAALLLGILETGLRTGNPVSAGLGVGAE